MQLRKVTQGRLSVLLRMPQLRGWQIPGCNLVNCSEVPMRTACRSVARVDLGGDTSPRKAGVAPGRWQARLEKPDVLE